ncbi:unnamed protein product [Ilex paraguariensis]|uniref:Galactokinase N-terminal domain-containing protein n=1 Tax=Ilex paraguariensis TaxID=185542 RepID=A0ABC8TS55_9AQUA
MGGLSWPSDSELDGIRKVVAEMSGRDAMEVRVVVSPYRICPLGAHIDHQGGTVLAMTINRGILLGFVPAGDSQGFSKTHEGCSNGGPVQGSLLLWPSILHLPLSMIFLHGIAEILVT